MNEVYNYLLNLLNDETVIVAVSSGPDSMALFDLLLKVRDIKPINIICAHVNHNVREESIIEEDYVRNFCKDNNVIFELYNIDNYSDDNFENEARCKRYNFFDECINKYNASILFTAHHSDDLMETILMRIVRGSSLKGYSGFSKVVDKGNYKIIRPLITVCKDDIIKYNTDNNIKYYIDKTNYLDIHTRNRYRKILPFFKNEDKDVNKKFIKFSETLLMYNNYIDNIVSNYKDNIYIDNYILIDKFKELDKLIQIKLINYVLDDLYMDDIMLLSDVHVNLIIDLIYNNKPNIAIRLPNDIIVRKSYNKLFFEKENIKKIDYEILLDNDIILPNGQVMFKNSDSKSNYVIRLNSKDIKLPLYIRNRRDGDKILIKNFNNYKKISKIFIDEKIPTLDRNNIPILVDSNNEILWVLGIKKSKYDININDNYDIVLVYERNTK